jgi:hypothetical protein
MKRGDRVAVIAQPIARNIDYFFGTNLQGCAGCKAMQNNLNAGMSFSQAIYDRFWPGSNNNQTGENNMQFIITKQIAVEAETPEEAFSKIGEGTTISLSVTARPQPQQQITQRPAVKGP